MESQDLDRTQAQARSGDVFAPVDHITPPAPRPVVVPRGQRPGTWAPTRQSSISALFRLVSSAQDATQQKSRERRARTLNDSFTLRRTKPQLQRGRRATTGQLPTVFRWVTTFVGQPVEETFWCQICFENVAVSEAFTLDGCGHQYCRPCFAAHLEQKIYEGDAFPVCFHPVLRDEEGENDRLFGRRTCGTRIPVAAIEQLCGADVWNQYAAQREEDEDDECECPYCYHIQTGSEHAESREAICSSCSRTFCTLHGSSHEDRSCADYELTTAKELKRSHAATAKNTKPCPSCKTSIEKTGNCNHMRCVVCTTSFCWLCGEHIDDSILPSHYDWAGESSCRGKQWDTATNSTMSDQMLAVAWQCALTAFSAPVAFLVAIVLKLLARCSTSKKYVDMTFREVFVDARVACEERFRRCVRFIVFGVFRYAVFLVCVAPALLLTVVLKIFTCIGTKPFRRFFTREFLVVFKDMTLMLATIVFTVVCAFAVAIVLGVGFIARGGEYIVTRWLSCCNPRFSTADTASTLQAEKEADKDLEAGRVLEVLAMDSRVDETPYSRVEAP